MRGADGRIYNSAVKPPSVPARLAYAILGVTGLQPQLRARPQAIIPVTPYSDLLQSGGIPYNPPRYGQTFGPLALLRYYHGLPVAHGGTLNFDGSGQTIAIILEQDDVAMLQSDLVQFWADTDSSHTLADLTIINPGWFTPTPGQNASNSAADEESTIDLEWASGMAEGAHIRFYQTYDPGLFVPQIIADKASMPGLNQGSESSGLEEQLMSPVIEKSDSQYYAALAAAGVTMFCPTGDWGSSPDNSGDGPGYPQSPPSVLYPACDPAVIAVGGTMLYFPNTGIKDPYTGYLQEDSTNAVAEYSWGSSGGGYSQVFIRPGWQTNLGPSVVANVNGNSGPAMRTIPDVAAVAANGNSVSFYVLAAGHRTTAAGTSFSSPIWAGMCALLNQARTQAGQASTGLLTPSLYAIANGSQAAEAFNDIVPMSTGPNGESPIHNNFNGAYAVGPGYDLVTGLGTPNVAGLIAALTVPQASQSAPLIELQPASFAINAQQNASFSVYAIGNPTPAYQWYFNGQAIPGATNATLGLPNVQFRIRGTTQ